MNRFARILALSLAAVAVFGCETQDKVDQGGVIVVISDYNLQGIPSTMSAETNFPSVGSSDATLVVRNQSRMPNNTTSQLMDVLIEGYEVSFTRGDQGTRLPPTLTEPVGGLVPIGGTMTQTGLILMRHDQFESGPLRDLRLQGKDTETNSTVVRLVWHLKFYGKTISGERVETPSISFNLDVYP
jgi:hypothetical protein